MKKIKHDHKGTKLLKLGIFASLMLAPLLAIAFKCAYVTFNKNAKESFYGETINETSFNNITNINDLKVGQEYYFDNSSSTSNLLNVTGTSMNILNIRNYRGNSEATINDNINNINNLYFSNSGTTNAYVGFRNGTTSIQNVSFQQSFSFYFTFNGINKDTYDTLLVDRTYTQSFNKYSYLDNAFYYAIDEMKNNELFNWTTNTALYTPTAAMTNGMGITTNALPILITYWLYLTAIYIVIDIVVELFTALTHMITSRFEQ